MRYLGLAIYAEGPTDYHFLCPVVQRVCEDICAQRAEETIEVSEVLKLNHPSDQDDESRAQRILAAAREARGAWTVLLIHSDGSNDPARIRRELVAPAQALITEEMGNAGKVIGIIPVRETEAWAIADGEALRQVFGTTLADDVLGVPTSARGIEGAGDPKQVLDAAFVATRPGARRARKGVSPMLNALGEQVRLERLRQLEAFTTFERELTEALRELRLLPQ